MRAPPSNAGRGKLGLAVARRCAFAAVLAYCFCTIGAANAMAQTPSRAPVAPLIALPGAPTAAPPSASPGASSAAPSGPSASPGTLPPVAPNRPAAEDSEFASADLQTAESTTYAVAPYMIGDFFVGNGQIIFFSKIASNPGRRLVGQIPSAGGSTRVKISDDNSVIPAARHRYAARCPSAQDRARPAACRRPEPSHPGQARRQPDPAGREAADGGRRHARRQTR